MFIILLIITSHMSLVFDILLMCITKPHVPLPSSSVYIISVRCLRRRLLRLLILVLPRTRRRGLPNLLDVLSLRPVFLRIFLILRRVFLLQDNVIRFRLIRLLVLLVLRRHRLLLRICRLRVRVILLVRRIRLILLRIRLVMLRLLIIPFNLYVLMPFASSYYSCYYYYVSSH